MTLNIESMKAANILSGGAAAVDLTSQETADTSITIIEML